MRIALVYQENQSVAPQKCQQSLAKGIDHENQNAQCQYAHVTNRSILAPKGISVATRNDATSKPLSSDDSQTNEPAQMAGSPRATVGVESVIRDGIAVMHCAFRRGPKGRRARCGTRLLPI